MMKKQLNRVMMILVTLICLVGCDKTKSNQQNTEIPISSQKEVTTQEKVPVAEESKEDGVGLFTTKKRQTLIIAGHEIHFPCQYEEFMEFFDPGFKMGFEEYPGIVFVEFEYNGKKAGTAIVKCSPDADYVEDTDWIFSLVLYDLDETDLSFEYCNINEGSSVNDVIENFGEPTKKDDDNNFYYYDDIEKAAAASFECDLIAFHYETERKMKEITLCYNINNLEEE